MLQKKSHLNMKSKRTSEISPQNFLQFLYKNVDESNFLVFIESHEKSIAHFSL